MWEEIRYKPPKMLKINTLQPSRFFPALPSQAINILEIKLLEIKTLPEIFPERTRVGTGRTQPSQTIENQKDKLNPSHSSPYSHQKRWKSLMIKPPPNAAKHRWTRVLFN